MRKFVWLGLAATFAVTLGVVGVVTCFPQAPGSFVGQFCSAARLAFDLSGPSVPEVNVARAPHASPVPCHRHAAPCPVAAPEEQFPEPKATTPPALVDDLVEIIHVEQGDGDSRDRTETPDVSQNRQQPDVAAPAANAGPDAVVLTILDSDEPAPLSHSVTATGASCVRPTAMPYCEEQDGEECDNQNGNAVEATHVEGIIIMPGMNADIGLVGSIVRKLVNGQAEAEEESTNLVMPYVADDDEVTDMPESGDASTANDTDSNTTGEGATGEGQVPAPENVNVPQQDSDYHHHREMHCPYLNGPYCPRYVPQHTPLVQPEEQPEPQPLAQPEPQPLAQPEPQPPAGLTFQAKSKKFLQAGLPVSVRPFDV